MSLVIIQIKFNRGNSIGMNLQNRGLKLSRSRNYQPVSVFIQRQGEGSKRKSGFNGNSGSVRVRVRVRARVWVRVRGRTRAWSESRITLLAISHQQIVEKRKHKTQYEDFAFNFIKENFKLSKFRKICIFVNIFENEKVLMLKWIYLK